MANVLCQLRGHKRLLLFPPSDVQHLHFSPGASSSSIDVFSRLNDIELAQTHPHEAILRPGDVLFLPALWLHTASPTEGVSVAVNVFFRTLENGYAPGKDVYGNRDLQAYEKGRQDVARVAKSFSNLPKDARKFYLLRLAEELKSMVDS
jgi:tRNA wybutosine-synthesizing protein 4